MSAMWERLAARAVELGRPTDETVRHHVLEGVLGRVARLPGADFVLRGGMLTRAWVAPQPRVAADLDFVGTFPHGVDETARRFRPALSAAGIEDGVCIDPASFRARGLWLRTAFPGVRLSVRAGLGAADQELQMDVGFNDPLVPPAYLMDYPTLLPGAPVRVWCVRPETAVAWKLHGLAEMGPQGWRPKDLLDLDLITRAVPLDTADLVPAIEAAFLSRGYALADAGVLSAPDWWGLKSARVKWADFRRERADLDVPDDLQAVVGRVHERLRPALRALGGITEAEGGRR
jgi:hypothetical protein